jgi:hypothetical protein
VATLCPANDHHHPNTLSSTENPNTKWRTLLTVAYSAAGYNTSSNGVGGMPSLGNRQPKSTNSKLSTTSMLDTPTNPAPCQKTYTKLRRTSALEGGYCHGVDQRLVLAVLMPIRCMCVACVCLYSCVHLYLCIFATCLCTSVCAYGFLSLLMPLVYAYVYLSICLWVMISAKEFSVGLRSMEEREVFSGGSVYIRGLVLPLFCLSFFLLHATFCILF